MTYNDPEIIVALATPDSRGGAIAVIRLSGAGSIMMVNACTKKRKLLSQLNHSLCVDTFIDGTDDLDDVIISVYFKGSSYTYEESVEISCHNSQYIIHRIISILIDHGARMANPGEFTQRAFMNGRFNITQAEAVADLIASNSKLLHDIAIQQMKGSYSRKIQSIRDDLVNIASSIELTLDFSQEHVESISHESLISKMNNVIHDVDELIRSYEVGEVIKSGLPISIIGKPNVGKSSILNALLGENRAIVSSIAGTTRDTIDSEIDIGGLKCRFIDTAGLRDSTSDEIERIGIERTKQTISKSKLILYILDINTYGDDDLANINDIRSSHKDVLVVYNKIDTYDHALPQNQCGDHIYISAQYGTNIDQIRKYIVSKYSCCCNEVVINMRHYGILKRCLEHLRNAYDAVCNGIEYDLVMIDMNLCIDELGLLTGQSVTDDILDSIFKNFCIGK